MLTDEDIDLIKETRKEVVHNRTEPVIAYHEVKGVEDPFTGTKTTEEVPEEVEVTWMSITSQSGTGGQGEFMYVNGVIAERDDAIIDVDISVNFSDVIKVKRVRTDEMFRVKSKDIKGLGEPNRYYVLLEKIQ